MLLTVLSDSYFTATRLDRPGASHPPARPLRTHRKRPSRLRPLAGVASLFAAVVAAAALLG
jgi:hypothetical protein